jgi:hypothetical protein
VGRIVRSSHAHAGRNARARRLSGSSNRGYRISSASTTLTPDSRMATPAPAGA